jgi:hypothetical protein
MGAQILSLVTARSLARRDGCHLHTALGLDNHTAVPREN